MLESARQTDQIEGLAKRSATMVRKFIKIYDNLSIKATAPLEDLLRFLVEEIGFEQHLEKTSVDQQDGNSLANVDELISAAVEFDRQHPDDGSLEAFLEQVALVADSDAFDGSSERVTLMTLHAAKGLEFPHVFIIGVEDDMLPHKRSKESEAELEEERRLLFVGITRAKQWLQLSCCKRRAMRGDVRPVIPSPFLNELPLEEMKRVETSREEDWFDEDPYANDDSFDESYPESWDLPDAASPESGGNSGDEMTSESTDLAHDETTQLTEDELAATAAGKKQQKTPVSIASSLKTAADLLSNPTTPLRAYCEGMLVRHADHGDGTIVSITGRGPKRIARVRFEDEERSFRLAFADLRVIKD